jgi:hypothetical protein
VATEHERRSLGAERQRRSLGSLAADITETSSLLVRLELELAQREMAEKGRRAATGIAAFALAAMCALAAFGAFVACLVLLLATVMASALAAALVALALAGVAGAAILVAVGQLRRFRGPLPEKTIQSIREDVRWIARPKTSSAR